MCRRWRQASTAASRWLAILRGRRPGAAPTRSRARPVPRNTESAMARPVWSGTLSFGLLNIPVSLMSGERRTDISFRMLDARNNAPIKYERVNAETGEEVPWKEIVKAFEYDKGSYVVLEPEDIKSAAPESHDAIEVEGFVDVGCDRAAVFRETLRAGAGEEGREGLRAAARGAGSKTGKIGIAPGRDPHAREPVRGDAAGQCAAAADDALSAGTGGYRRIQHSGRRARAITGSTPRNCSSPNS